MLWDVFFTLLEQWKQGRSSCLRTQPDQESVTQQHSWANLLKPQEFWTQLLFFWHLSFFLLDLWYFCMHWHSMTRLLNIYTSSVRVVHCRFSKENFCFLAESGLRLVSLNKRSSNFYWSVNLVLSNVIQRLTTNFHLIVSHLVFYLPAFEQFKLILSSCSLIHRNVDSFQPGDGPLHYMWVTYGAFTQLS